MFKKLISFAVVAVLVLSATLSVFAAGDENLRKVTRLRCAAVAGTEYGSIDGFEFPSDAELVSDSVKAPQTVGAKDGNIVGVGVGASFRTSIPADADKTEITYDLTDDERGASFDGCVAIGVYVSTNGTPDGKRASAVISLEDKDGESHSVRTSLRLDEPYIVYVDTSEIKGGVFEKMTLTLTSDASQKSLSVITSLPTETESIDLSTLRGFKILSVSSGGGGISFDDGEITLGTDDGDIGLSILFESTATKDSSQNVFVTLNCSRGEGSVAAASSTGTYTELTHAVSESSVQVPVRASCTVGGEVQLSFKSGAKEKLSFSSIGCVVADTVSVSDGSFTSLVCTDDVITASGRIAPDIVSQYSSEYIGLYTESVTSPAEPELLVKARMTSRFSFSASIKEHPHAHADNTFFVGVITSDGVRRVTDSRFAAAYSSRRSGDGILGLYRANPISVYESAVQYMLVDVDLADFVTDASASSTTVSRGGYIYGIDTKKLAELDYDMNFYSSIGVSVYIRIIGSDTLSSSAASSMTYSALSAEERVARANAPEALNVYPAVASFLSQRYTSIKSFVITSGANSTRLTGISSDEQWDGAASLVMISRLVYGAAAKYLPDITLTLPLVSENDDNVGELYASPELFCAMFGAKLASVGDIPWEIMYTSRTATDNVRYENIKNTANLNSASAPTYLAALYELSESDGDSTTGYEAFCEELRGTSIRAVFLDVGSVEAELSRESYSRLKSSDSSRDGTFYESVAGNASSLDSLEIAGSASLWDFSSSYSTGGWRAGYGMTCVVSASGAGVGAMRRLCCMTDSDSPAGIFLVSLGERLALSDAQIAEFKFSLPNGAPSDALSDDVRLVFVFGNDTSRAEYSLESLSYYEKDGELCVVCDLSDCEKLGEISYIGVIVYSPSAVEISMSSVTAHSLTLDSAALEYVARNVTSVASTDDESDVRVLVEYIIAGVIASAVVVALTIRAAVLLSRRDAENSKAEKSVKKRKF